MDVLIKKGSHYSSGFSIGQFHTGRTSMSYRVTFDSNCMTLPGVASCDTDTNKLFGWSYGMHHTNSIRVGWRVRDGRIRLMVYLYEKGVRRIVGFAWADPNVPIEVSVDLGADNMLTFKGGSVTFRTPWMGASPSWGYNLKPYYGGNCPAPVDMHITLE